MDKFSSSTIQAIKHYVYLLVNPKDNTIFYVGEGKGNRVFAHEKAYRKTQNARNEKEKRIEEILLGNKEVSKYILRLGLEKNEAFIVESVIINLLGSTEAGDMNTNINLTNIQCGHGMRNKGLMTVEEVEHFYGTKPLLSKNIKHSLLCININRRYEKDTDLYEATRKSWKVNPNNANKCDFVASEYQGIIMALYKVNEAGWKQDLDSENKRYYFEGTQVTDEGITKLYINKRIIKSNSNTRPSRNPIRYLCNKTKNNKSK